MVSRYQRRERKPFSHYVSRGVSAVIVLALVAFAILCATGSRFETGGVTVRFLPPSEWSVDELVADGPKTVTVMRRYVCISVTHTTTR